MTEKSFETAQVIRQDRIAEGICRLLLQTDNIAARALPGQFVSLYCKDQSRMLPRPISVCETDPGRGRLLLVYRIAGAGTKEFSHLKAGDTIDLLGPLGNGFPLERCTSGKRALLIGGGIGIPPLVELAKRLAGEVQIVCGYRSEPFLQDAFSGRGRFYAATEDGCTGTKGTVLDCIRENALSADIIYSCGPLPMLRVVKQFAEETGTECWVSMEEKMACGIGACLACVCRTAREDEHSRVHNARICREGPVFRADTVLLS